MGRHKTLQQKKLADLRRQKFVYTLENKILPSIDRPTDNSSSPKTITISNYSYIQHDILKTSLLTASIIGLQIVLFFILKNHIITLPIVKY